MFDTNEVHMSMMMSNNTSFWCIFVVFSRDKLVKLFLDFFFKMFQNIFREIEMGWNYPVLSKTNSRKNRKKIPDIFIWKNVAKNGWNSFPGNWYAIFSISISHKNIALMNIHGDKTEYGLRKFMHIDWLTSARLLILLLLGLKSTSLKSNLISWFTFGILLSLQ